MTHCQILFKTCPAVITNTEYDLVLHKIGQLTTDLENETDHLERIMSIN